MRIHSVGTKRPNAWGLYDNECSSLRIEENMKIKTLLLAWIIMSFSVILSARTNELDAVNGYWLTDRIFIVGYGAGHDDMIAAIQTAKGIVIIDTGMSHSVTADYRAVIERELGRSDFKYVINTHHHDDHTYGNQVFREAEIIAHHNMATQMINDYENGGPYIQQVNERNDQLRQLLQTLDKDSDQYTNINNWMYPFQKMCEEFESTLELTLPTLTFTENLILDMGDLSIELAYFGPGFHTNNSIMVSIPEEQVVFMGDLARQYDQYYPVNSKTSGQYFDSWIQSLTQILKTNGNVRHIVAYHEGILPGKHLISFHNNLMKMQNNFQHNKSAVDSLRILISESGLPKALDLFENQFIDKKNTSFYIWIGDLMALVGEFQENGQYDEAVSLLKMCEKAFPNSSMAISRQGRIFVEKGDRKSAIEIYKRYLHKKPDNYYTIARIFKLENHQ
ncbi:MBL fold metallo-hydrolase [bacterium]|nr:MBL fold metallo-hydrolase [bacterium]